MSNTRKPKHTHQRIQRPLYQEIELFIRQEDIRDFGFQIRRYMGNRLLLLIDEGNLRPVIRAYGKLIDVKHEGKFVGYKGRQGTELLINQLNEPPYLRQLGLDGGANGKK